VILSHKHRFLFLKTHKTAGTSIELFLSQFCGPDDIITPLCHEDERLRRELGFPPPQNCFVPYRNYKFRDLLRCLLSKRRKLRFQEHSGYDTLVGTLKRNNIAPDFLDGYFKFCFERNPYDKLVSAYFFRRKANHLGSIDFIEFLRSTDAIHHHAGRKLWMSGGCPAMDFIGRFENLEQDLAYVLDQIGLDVELHLPRAKTHYRTDRDHYSKWYPTEESRTFVRFLYEFEMVFLGYEFEDGPEEN
jgi:hypothetical protein